MVEIPEKYAQMMKDTAYVYSKNKFWRRFQENAPSDVCKAMIGILFTNSMISGVMEEDDFKKFAHFIRDNMSIEDWKYYRRIGKGTPFWEVCNKHIRALGGTP